MEHKKFEYNIVSMYWGLSLDQEQQILNEQGIEGWELCTRTDIEKQSKVEFVFKRAVLNSVV